MTKVPEYNLPKFGPAPKSQQEKYNSRYWRYKKKTPPKDTYKPKTRLKDKTLYNQDIANFKHVQSIKYEV